MRRRTRASLVLVLALASGCATTRRDWEAARQADTSQAYSTFLREHPEAEQAPEAWKRIREEDAWQRAKSADTTTAYDAFVARHPSSSHAAAAREALKRLEAEASAAAAPTTNSPATAGSFLSFGGGAIAAGNFKPGGTMTFTPNGMLKLERMPFTGVFTVRNEANGCLVMIKDGMTKDEVRKEAEDCKLGITTRTDDAWVLGDKVFFFEDGKVAAMGDK